jgi:hypothetical protein
MGRGGSTEQGREYGAGAGMGEDALEHAPMRGQAASQNREPTREVVGVASRACPS